jgi:glycerol 3-phosphatase-2
VPSPLAAWVLLGVGSGRGVASSFGQNDCLYGDEQESRRMPNHRPHTLIERYDGFLIDLDGVVYVGDTAVPGAAEAITELQRRGKGVLFVTNDSRSSREQFRNKLARMAINVGEDDILTAGRATAEYIVRHETHVSRAFVIGTDALKAEVQAVGLIVDDEEPNETGVVIVGGHEGFNYDELRIAARLVRQGARLYAPGRDATFPMPDGPWPGTGAVLAAVETAAGASAIVIGKPEPHMFQTACELMVGRDRLVVIGDRLDSDIEGGRRAGMATILIAGAADPSPSTEVAADHTIPSLAALIIS